MEYLILFYATSVVVAFFVVCHLKNRMVRGAVEALLNRGVVATKTMVVVCVAIGWVCLVLVPVVNTRIGWGGMRRLLDTKQLFKQVI